MIYLKKIGLRRGKSFRKQSFGERFAIRRKGNLEEELLRGRLNAVGLARAAAAEANICGIRF